jgi:hypothetical protein
MGPDELELAGSRQPVRRRDHAAVLATLGTVAVAVTSSGCAYLAV